MKKVAVFGIGYVGCVSAACLSRDGHDVVGVDVDAAKVALLNAGRSPVAEPGLAELIAAQVSAGSLRATCDLAAAVEATEMALVAVGTPSAHDGSVSSATVENVVRQIGETLRGSQQRYTIVVRSTLLPGILEERLAPLLADACGEAIGERVKLLNNPEFLRESSAISDYDAPPYVLVGANDASSAAEVLELYAKSNAETIATDTRTAALVKYTCNGFHALKVAYANEIGSLARLLGADGTQVMEIACRDTKLNISSAYLRPGFAFGGSCLPKDLRAMTRHAQREALAVPLLDSILASNQQHLQRAVELIAQSGRRLGIIGLSFKAGTDDLRESPFVALAETLIGKGCDVKIYDPGVAIARLKGQNLAYIDQHLPHLARLLVETPAQICEHADLVILGTSVGDSFAWSEHFPQRVIDLRRALITALPDSIAP